MNWGQPQHTHIKSTLPWQQPSWPSELSPFSHIALLSFLLPISCNSPTTASLLVPTVSFLDISGLQGSPIFFPFFQTTFFMIAQAKKKQRKMCHLFLLLFSRWKSSVSVTCGQSIISVSAAKKWEKFSNHRLSLPEPMISSSGEWHFLFLGNSLVPIDERK